MKLTEKIAKYDKARPWFSFEFFPPKTDQVRLVRSSVEASLSRQVAGV